MNIAESCFRNQIIVFFCFFENVKNAFFKQNFTFFFVFLILCVLCFLQDGKWKLIFIQKMRKYLNKHT